MWYVMSTHSALTVEQVLWRVASHSFAQKHDAEAWKESLEQDEKKHRFFLIQMEDSITWPRI